MAGMAMDLSGYLARIGLDGRPRPDLGTLHAIVAAHNRSIPFENLDPLLGIPVADLSAEALSAKLVDRRRGGYCYEHNGLLGYVLEELGFDVERLSGRVVWMRADDAPLPAQTHNVLSVAVPGADGRYLVDVGFGGQTLTSPIRLEAGPVQQTRHEPYRLTRRGDTTRWRPRSAVSGNRCTRSPPSRGRASTSRSEAGTSQHIRGHTSSPGSRSRWSPRRAVQPAGAQPGGPPVRCDRAHPVRQRGTGARRHRQPVRHRPRRSGRP